VPIGGNNPARIRSNTGEEGKAADVFAQHAATPRRPR
jgi:hypothetical protein